MVREHINNFDENPLMNSPDEMLDRLQELGLTTPEIDLTELAEIEESLEINGNLSPEHLDRLRKLCHDWSID